MIPFLKKNKDGKKPPKSTVPRTAQESIPFQRMFEDGTCRVRPGYYTRTIQYQDINYQLAQQEDKTAIFEEWCSFLNFFDSSIHFELSFVNTATDSADFEKSIRIPYQKDGFDDVRAEYSQMLRQQLSKGNNGLTKTKFLTYGIEGESMAQVKPRLEHIQNDLMNNFHRLGVLAKPLDGTERLRLMHGMLNMDGANKFHFNWKDLVPSGLSVKDAIAPTALAFKNSRTFQMGGIFGAVSFLNITASDLSDQLLKDFLDMDSSQIVTMHIQSVDQNKAIKTIKHTITELDRSKIEEQKKAVRAGYDMDVLPSDLATYGRDAKALLKELQSQNERMFLVTFLVLNTGRTEQELENNVFQASSIAQKHNCNLCRLDFQQEQGLMSSLPLADCQIEIQRGLTTSSTAIFIPFTTQELYQSGKESLYYGLNALSNNLIMVDRKKLKNPNGLILGTPGSGKSFSAKREITNAFLVTDDDIIINDPEGEYSPLVNRLKGQVIKISPNSTQFVNRMDIVQQYEQLPNGNWVLADDDMTVDLSWSSNKTSGGLQVERTTKYSNYKFDPIEQRLFRLKGPVIKEADMLSKSDEYWASVRQVPLTKKESTMDLFVNRLEQIPGFKYIIFGAKALIENFVETGSKEHPSKVDIGPINTMISSNYIDGTRFRLSGMTTAHFDKHWFLSGYGAYGLKDERWKYSGTVTYSFNKRDYVVWEFPKHYLSATYSYDVMSPMDKFLFTDKDNIFLSVKTTTVDQMSYMRDATINYELETLTGFGVKAMLRHRNDEPTGKLEYLRNDAAQTRVHDVTTSEASLTLRYAPGESFVNSKQRRVPVSLDAPIFTLTHAMGFKGVLGGDYNFNRTEASVWKRFWLPASWGKIDCSVKAGAEWNTVPFPLLILPEANLSYITQRETFNLINNMEFLNDRYASMSLSYDMNGKLFNRIPLIKNLKWREMFRVRALWGTLTDKNNPFKSNNPDLFRFPTRDGKFTSFVMDPKVPYVEASVGIYNIFKLLHVEYVHRFTYRDNPGINKNGIRFMVLMVF